MPTLLTEDSGKCIRIEVLSASPVNYIKVEFLQLFQPSCELALWVPKVSQPSERSMVCMNHKVPAQEVQSELLWVGYNG